jgi:hypothetical protein
MKIDPNGLQNRHVQVGQDHPGFGGVLGCIHWDGTIAAKDHVDTLQRTQLIA